MTYEQLLRHYKTKAEAAIALGVHQNAINNWRLRGKIPIGQQISAERLTRGKLKADLPGFRTNGRRA